MLGLRAHRTRLFSTSALSSSWTRPAIPTAFPRPRSRQKRRVPSPWVSAPAALALTVTAGWLAYEYVQPVRHTALAAVRCARCAKAVVASAVDYKLTYAREYEDEDARVKAESECHSRSAQRVLKALIANGGVFIKLGQHVSSLIVLPIEWTSAMRPLQDKCDPTDYEHIAALFEHDMGAPLSDYFSSFDQEPIGVASLAQVHRAVLASTGEEVAVKLQHPHLAEFCEVDMEMVEVALGAVKRFFPTFELTWLGEEMRENLPKEMDFAHEARNAERAEADFAHVRTALHIPSIVAAKPRILIMEFVRGARVDDLEYLAQHNIDRNKVALELARIFARMVYLNGYFHGDPHAGNLLIRPTPPGSRSPYNFEISLLDHGLYFDLSDQLRVDYARLWLAFLMPGSAEVIKLRQELAWKVGNVPPERYYVFETALTGRANMAGSGGPEDTARPDFERKSSLTELGTMSEAETDSIRRAIASKEGLLSDVMAVLRGVPRRVLMVFKLNDLTRALDAALRTTHHGARVFLVGAEFCARAIFWDDVKSLGALAKEHGVLAPSVVWGYFRAAWTYERTALPLAAVAFAMDAGAAWARARDWTAGVWRGGWSGGKKAAAGLELA